MEQGYDLLAPMAILTMLGFVYVTDYHIPASQPITSSLPSKDMFVVNTGANSGFGFQTAKSLIEEQGSNIKVIMACRSMKKCQDGANQVDSKDDKQAIPIHLFRSARFRIDIQFCRSTSMKCCWRKCRPSRTTVVVPFLSRTRCISVVISIIVGSLFTFVPPKIKKNVHANDERNSIPNTHCA